MKLTSGSYTVTCSVEIDVDVEADVYDELVDSGQISQNVSRLKAYIYPSDRALERVDITHMLDKNQIKELEAIIVETHHDNDDSAIR